MKAIGTIAAAAALLAGAPSWAQTSSTPPQGSTGPQDTRQVDQSLAPAPPGSAGPSMTNPRTDDNWRSSSGLNSDPNNPSGAPGSSAIGTAPTR